MLLKEKEDKISKFLSYVLRHKPEEIGIELDENGWTSIKDLIDKSTDYKLSFDIIKFVVTNNKKQRFALSSDETMIRANQGHTIEVDLDLPYVEPPEVLYHGTTVRFLESILKEGLKPMERHDVHLSFSKKIAHSVGERHGKVAILEIQAKEMYRNGYKFQCTKNNVWLTKFIPIQYIKSEELKKENKLK